VQDAPTPSPSGTAAIAALRLAELTGDAAWRARAEALVGAFAGSAAELGLHAATLLIAADWLLHPATHLAVVSAAGDGEGDRMHRLALAAPLPRRVVHRLVAGTPAGELPPALAAMVASAGGGVARGFLCVGESCRAPIEGVAAWGAALGALR
jgi:uncharacterized protein YyaL (SSP411 family)